MTCYIWTLILYSKPASVHITNPTTCDNLKYIQKNIMKRSREENVHMHEFGEAQHTDELEDDDLGSPAKKRVRFVEKQKNESTSQNFVIKCDVFGHSDKGKKGTMEDRLLIENDLSRISNHPYFQENTKNKNANGLYCVFDGHGGSKIASNLQMNFKDLIMSQLIKYNYNNSNSNSNNNNNNNNNSNSNETENDNRDKVLNIQKALHASFKLMDQRILQYGTCASEGSTATVVYIENNMVFSANIGDSKAVLARLPKKEEKQNNDNSNNNNGNDNETIYPNAISLTIDDTVLQLNESKRILNSNGLISHGRVNGILEITRSFGDSRLKKCGVIAVPHISKFNICKDERDLFLIIACDGLWSVFNPSDAVKFVYDKFQSKTKPSVKHVVRQLLAEAILNKQAKDNVSAIIVKFKKQF